MGEILEQIDAKGRLPLPCKNRMPVSTHMRHSRIGHPAIDEREFEENPMRMQEKQYTEGQSIDPIDRWAFDADAETFARIVFSVNAVVQHRLPNVGNFLNQMSSEKFNDPQYRVRTLHSIRGRFIEVVHEHPEQASAIFATLHELSEYLLLFNNDALNLLRQFAYKPGEHQRTALRTLQQRDLFAREILQQIEHAEAETLRMQNKE